MAIQYSNAVRDAKNNAVEATVGTSPILRIYNGTKPATPATALSGNTLLAEGTLPSDWLSNSSGGTKSKTGTWTATGQSGAGAGTNATFARIYRSDGTTCDIQLTITATGGGGDMTMDNISIADAQVITVNTYSTTENNP